MSAATEYRYHRLTWEEINDAVAAQKVVVLPTGSTEQHGPHLPLDVGAFLVESVCLELGRLAPDRVRMDKAVADNDVAGKYMSSDSTSPHVRFNDFWGRWTKVGVHGDPTAATAEKGKIIWEAVLSRLVELVERAAPGRFPSGATSTPGRSSRTSSGESRNGQRRQGSRAFFIDAADPRGDRGGGDGESPPNGHS